MLWLCKTKISWESKIVLHEYRQFHCIQKNRWFIYKDNGDNVETRFDTSNYELDRPLPKEKKKVIGLMKDKLSGKTMIKFVILRQKVLVT